MNGTTPLRIIEGVSGNDRCAMDFQAWMSGSSVTEIVPTIVKMILSSWRRLDYLTIFELLRAKHDQKAREEQRLLYQWAERAASATAHCDQTGTSCVTGETESYIFSDRESATSWLIAFFLSIMNARFEEDKSPEELSSWLPEVDVEPAVYELVACLLGINLDLCREKNLRLMILTGEPTCIGFTRHQPDHQQKEQPFNSIRIWLNVHDEMSFEDNEFSMMEAWPVEGDSSRPPLYTVKGIWVPCSGLEKQPWGGYPMSANSGDSADAILI